MWSWVDPSLKEALSGNDTNTYLTGPLGSVACITTHKSRYECLVLLPNAKPVSFCREKDVNMGDVKMEVCKVVLNMIAGCMEQLKSQCGESLKDYLIVPQSVV